MKALEHVDKLIAQRRDMYRRASSGLYRCLRSDVGEAEKATRERVAEGSETDLDQLAQNTTGVLHPLPCFLALTLTFALAAHEAATVTVSAQPT